MSDEITKPPSTSNNSLAPKLSHFGTKTRVKFNGSCLKQDKITYAYGKIINIYIVYELSPNLNYNENVTLGDFLFGAVKLTENDENNKCKYSGQGTFLFPCGGFGQNVIIFGVDMSSSVHVHNKKKDILILVEGPTQGVDDTTLTSEKKAFNKIYCTQKKNLFKLPL